ncbi:hypothetical protein CLV98_103103 [Dyadobacter jejuensis]|uniref:Uncharacterized protein n=1 Tax=Dyadobacter jejuensis TaxID=1082580 RepID=A0A316B813_9BACT|nr:hypothetical protein [Dyadobacter jejuensis]PWJ58737.1 hypothetical protein CLV98_103103 [Dyadobacter jejuensis]
MKEQEMINLWKSQGQKLDKALAVNQVLMKEMMNRKAAGVLDGLKWFKGVGIILGILYVTILGTGLFYAITHYSPAWNYFIVSVAAIALINLKSIADYIRHLVMAQQIDFDGPVTEIQQSLVDIQRSILGHCRIAVLQLPFYTTFYLSSSWFSGSVGWGFVVLRVSIILAFVVGAIWLYKAIKMDNLHKPWLKKLVIGAGGGAIIKAQAIYEELEAYQKAEE